MEQNMCFDKRNDGAPKLAKKLNLNPEKIDSLPLHFDGWSLSSIQDIMQVFSSAFRFFTS
jgi:hypothetical protein